jgi:hypothetical protein
MYLVLCPVLICVSISKHTMIYVALTLQINDVSSVFVNYYQCLVLCLVLIYMLVLQSTYVALTLQIKDVSSVFLNYYRDCVSVLCLVSIYVGASKTIVSNSASWTKMIICS